MPVVSSEKLISLQHNPEAIRNICILAHVDHGKTSLTDVLLATNGIISPRLAGKIRYLDSRPDEQLRGITMESSAISLYFSMLRRSTTEADATQKEYLVNLIDSPGHIDFSSEVSTASRLCDGALVLVDAVEGVCSQTVTVLRQTWTEHLKPLLVINKVDRLITELKMSSVEAYAHLTKLLEQVNAVIGSFFQGERMEEDLQWRERIEERVFAASVKDQLQIRHEITDSGDAHESIDVDRISVENAAGEFAEKDDEDLYFAPEKNNVIFSSATDGWAFTIRQFASIYERKMGIKRSILEKALWGDFYLEPKSKRVLGSKHLKGRALKPMFVQLVLDNIWAVYEATTGGNKGKGDPLMIEKIIKSLSLSVSSHILRSRDPRAILTTILAAWLPLSTAVLVSVTEHLPSPITGQATRLPSLIDSSPGAKYIDQSIRDAIVNFKATYQDPVVAYVSKMVSVSASELPENKRQIGNGFNNKEFREIAQRKRAEFARAAAETDSLKSTNGLPKFSENSGIGETDDVQQSDEVAQDDAEHLIGFARLYSGILSVGDTLYVLPPKFSPANLQANLEPSKITVTGLYLMMGRSLEALKTVPAGIVFGIAGLEGHILKSGTLCSQLKGSVNLAGVNTASQPIVRVALEPVHPSDLDKLVRGMQMLEQSDSCARYEVLDSGEHVISTAGELHLERCMKDLRERFAKCEIQVGEPIVPYRETITSAADMAPLQDKGLPRGTVISTMASKQISIRLRVRPLPLAATNFIEKNIGLIRHLYIERKASEENRHEQPIDDLNQMNPHHTENSLYTDSELNSPLGFKKDLQSLLNDEKGQSGIWADAVEKIVSFGPRRIGPNLLIDVTEMGTCQRFFYDNRSTEANQANFSTVHDLIDKVSYAFQLATHQGPLCHEPIQGIAVFLEEFVVHTTLEENSLASDTHGRLIGEVIKVIRDSIRQGFLEWSPRLLLAMYSCEIQASAEVLGRVYGVITRRRGRIVSEALKEGTPFFTILAVLPVAESFGFSDEIRKRTSGAASPQLVFQGFEVLDEDPFWVPFTEDELEDLGELADKENVAKRYMDTVRVRKGLEVKGKKLVKDAEKQKNLKR